MYKGVDIRKTVKSCFIVIVLSLIVLALFSYFLGHEVYVRGDYVQSDSLAQKREELRKTTEEADNLKLLLQDKEEVYNSLLFFQVQPQNAINDLQVKALIERNNEINEELLRVYNYKV